MLTAMRQGAHSKIVKFVVFSFLLFAVAGMALMDVGGFFRGGVQNNTVAEVAGLKINGTDFDRKVRRTISQQAMLDTKMAYQLGLIDQYLNSQVSDILLQKAAQEQGIVINESLMAEQIAKLLGPYAKDEASAKDAFRKLLMSQNLTEAEFVSLLRSQVSTNMIRSALQRATATVSTFEANDLYQQKHEQRTVKLIHFPNKGMKGVEKPGDDILLPFYQAGQEKYAVPETRKFTLALMTEDSVRKTLNISDEELQQVFEDRANEFTEKEKRVLQQAVFTSEEDAQKALEQVKSGKSLKDVAKSSYIGEESFEQAGLLKEIADPAFALQAGETTDPIKTSLGWHILTLKEIKAPKEKTFDEVKETLRKELIDEKVLNEMVQTSGTLDDSLASGEDLESVVKNFHLTSNAIGPVKQDGSTIDNKDGFKDYPRDRQSILETAFSLEPGEISSVQEMSNGNYFIVRIDSVTPKTYKPFESVKAELAATWVADQEDVLNRQRAQETLQALQSGSKTLEQAAKDNGIDVKSVTLTNSEQPKEPVTDPLQKLLFGNDKGTYQLAPSKDGYTIAMVTDVKMPDPAKASKEEIAKVTATASQGTQDEVFLVFLNELRQEHGVKVNREVLDRMYAAGSEDPQQQF